MTTEWVRVRDDRTDHEYTVSRAEADMDKHLEILDDKDAVDVNGRPLPPKPRRRFSDNNSEGEGPDLKPLPTPDTKPVAPKTPAKPTTTEGK